MQKLQGKGKCKYIQQIRLYVINLSPGTSLNLQDVPPKKQTPCSSSEIFELSSSTKEESCDKISVSCHPVSSVEMMLKLSLLIFLFLLLVYHIYNLIQTGSFEPETCDIDNHSNYLKLFGVHNEQHHLT